MFPVTSTMNDLPEIDRISSRQLTWEYVVVRFHSYSKLMNTHTIDYDYCRHSLSLSLSRINELRTALPIR
jgi:hypothetical protein